MLPVYSNTTRVADLCRGSLRLSAVLDGIDLSWKDPYDHRPSQLGAVLNATASLALALSECVDKRNISEKSLELASRIDNGSKKS
jgi:hypothetical protein